jgi:hypothetical protein
VTERARNTASSSEAAISGSRRCSCFDNSENRKPSRTPSAETTIFDGSIAAMISSRTAAP